MLKNIANISNSSIVKSADGLFYKKSDNIDFEWVDKSKSILASDKYKVSY